LSASEGEPTALVLVPAVAGVATVAVEAKIQTGAEGEEPEKQRARMHPGTSLQRRNLRPRKKLGGKEAASVPVCGKAATRNELVPTPSR